MADFEAFDAAQTTPYSKDGIVAAAQKQYCQLFKDIYSVSADRNDFFGAAMEYYRNLFDAEADALYDVSRALERVLA